MASRLGHEALQHADEADFRRFIGRHHAIDDSTVEAPRQFGGHLFAFTLPGDHTCYHCGTSLHEALVAWRTGGVRAAICPAFGPEDPDEREAFIAKAELANAQNDPRGHEHHRARLRAFLDRT